MMRQSGAALSEVVADRGHSKPWSEIAYQAFALVVGVMVAAVTDLVVQRLTHAYVGRLFVFSGVALSIANFVALGWKKYEFLSAGVLMAWALTFIARPYAPMSIFTPLFLFGVVNSVLLAAASLAFGAFPGPNLDPNRNLPPSQNREMTRLERLARLRERQVQAAIDFAEIDYVKNMKVGLAALLPPIAMFGLFYAFRTPLLISLSDWPMFAAFVGFAFYLNVLGYQLRRLFAIPALFGFFFFTLTTLVSVANQHLNLHILAFAIAPFSLGLVNSGVFYVLARRFGLLENPSRRALKGRNS